MALVPWRKKETWDPFKDLLDIQQEMNRLFSNSLFGSVNKRDAGDNFWAPAVDIHEEKDKYVIKADLPGIKQEDIDISVEDDMLTIRGERKQETEEKERNYYRCERTYGAYQRSFTLPSLADAAKIEANYNKGVLQLTIPKAEEKQKKQIKIDVK